MTQAYPLQWPAGWPRMSSHGRKRAKFGKSSWRGGQSWEPGSYRQKGELTIADGTQRIIDELRTLGVRDGQWVISSNLELRNDGLPRSGQRMPEDPGIAVYWTRKGKQNVMAIDLYDRVADNLAAVAATLSAMRAIERHGGAQVLERAFEGFAALPSPGAARSWREVLKFPPPPMMPVHDQIVARFRSLAQERHPDAGGSNDAMAELSAARDAALLAIARP